MKLLAIESAAVTASVAIITDDTLTAEYSVSFKKTHSQTLLPMIDEIVSMIGLDLNELDAIAISGGPGSFTGLRIGSATAKGLGLALNKPLIHIPTLDAMAYQIFGTDAAICPMLDARRENVFTGIYEHNEKFNIIKEQHHSSVKELCEELNKLGRRVCFLGDGVRTYESQIKEYCTVPFFFAKEFANGPRAGTVASLAKIYFAEGKMQTATEHAPDYLRLSQAEWELKSKQK
ncbi:Inactive metal-dependent protease [Lachnospiraceae bacterium TWA4]|nr:Inactive metal-dependent protease [Lachnospiraceae bacterium TWA4]